ncbi:hypothetical protein N7513_012549 [Penicillium frequentans]|nr:hypothetical protein N7513_012549 [Penicillium glabrum]
MSKINQVKESVWRKFVRSSKGSTQKNDAAPLITPTRQPPAREKESLGKLQVKEAPYSKVWIDSAWPTSYLT